LVNEAQATFPLQGLAERLGSPEAVLHWQLGDEKQSLEIPGAAHLAALEQLLPLAQEAAGGKIDGIGHRVVHGGEHFTGSCLITADALPASRADAHPARRRSAATPGGLGPAFALCAGPPQVAVFDTAYHQTMPGHAYRYAVPEFLYKEHNVRRYGFHGTSHHFVSKRAAEMTNLPVEDSCWLTAHLGNGCSTCAVVNGESRDTSMGMTPLEGLVMGTRSGDVDPN